MQMQPGWVKMTILTHPTTPVRVEIRGGSEGPLHNSCVGGNARTHTLHFVYTTGIVTKIAVMTYKDQYSKIQYVRITITLLTS
jgi:hypothetical protein